MESFYGRWGCVEVYFDWMGLGENFFELARICGGISWVVGGK